MLRTSREVRSGACRGHADAHSKAHSLTSFHDFGLNEPITRALAQENYAPPPPIQAQTIPIILSGRESDRNSPDRDREMQWDGAARQKDHEMKEELLQFEGLVTEILPDARYRVQLDVGHAVVAY